MICHAGTRATKCIALSLAVFAACMALSGCCCGVSRPPVVQPPPTPVPPPKATFDEKIQSWQAPCPYCSRPVHFRTVPSDKYFECTSCGRVFHVDDNLHPGVIPGKN